MKKFEENTVNIFGKKGKIWLNQLPNIIDSLSEIWSLTDIKPVINMNINYVARATQSNIPVVLKISYDKELIANEYRTLKYFHGHGMIQVLDWNEKYNAILLEQAIPGDLLKVHHPKNIVDTIDIYANVVKAIAATTLADQSKFRHVREWLNTLDRITDNRIKKDFINKAKELRENILNTMTHEYLCHGDLHLENIIQHNSKWISIDPKGIIGEMAFEAAAFDLISNDELLQDYNISSIIYVRISQLAKILNLKFDRLLAWFFIRKIISAQWFIEDNGDPTSTLNITTYLYPLLI